MIDRFRVHHSPNNQSPYLVGGLNLRALVERHLRLVQVDLVLLAVAAGIMLQLRARDQVGVVHAVRLRLVVMVVSCEGEQCGCEGDSVVKL